MSEPTDIERALGDERDIGHVELHIVPTRNHGRVRVLLATGGRISRDTTCTNRELPGLISELLTGAAFRHHMGGIFKRLGFGGG